MENDSLEYKQKQSMMRTLYFMHKRYFKSKNPKVKNKMKNLSNEEMKQLLDPDDSYNKSEGLV
jgi:hypothetical protein